MQLVPLTKLPDTIECYVTGPFKPDFYGEQGEYGIASLQQSPQFKGLPSDVQEWIQAHEDGEPPELTQKQPYLQDSDGSLVFTFTKKTSDAWRKETGLAVYSPGNASVVEYLQDGSQVDEDSFGRGADLQLVGFPKYPPFTAWCAVFEIKLSKNIQDEMICYNANSSVIKRFPPVKDSMPSFGASGSSKDNSIFATDDTLWVAVKRDVNRERQGSVSTVMITLTVFHATTMEKKLVAERNMARNNGGSGGPGETRALNQNCRVEYYVSSWISFIALCSLFAYLYRLDVPSCVFPACLAAHIMTDGIVPSRNITALVMLSLACLCLCFLGATKNSTGSAFRFVSVLMTIWALYSLLFCSSLGFLSQLANMRDMWYFFDASPGELILIPFMSFVVAAAISVLLKHPVFEILAACISVIACFSCLFIFAGVRYLLVPVVLFTFSLGCFRVGGVLQLYRVHVLVYARRVWRCLRTRCCSQRQGGTI